MFLDAQENGVENPRRGLDAAKKTRWCLAAGKYASKIGDWVFGARPGCGGKNRTKSEQKQKNPNKTRTKPKQK